MADSGKIKFCNQCGVHHEAPTGKRKCKGPLPDVPVHKPTAPVSTPDAEQVAEASSISDMTSGLTSLITVVSTLPTCMDVQQEQLNQLQGVIQPVVDQTMPTAATGAITKRPTIQQLWFGSDVAA
jgi:hypothetical protein